MSALAEVTTNGRSGQRFGGRIGARPGPRLSVVVPATNEPPTLPRVLNAVARSFDRADEIIVVRVPNRMGPAAARNAGAAVATGEVVVFVDADIELHPDALARIRAAFDADPDLTALFGSYDDDPSEGDAVSGFRNLLHHWVHQTNDGEATTFWAGIGAVRREAFLHAGGFDARRFSAPSVEDVDLGLRLSARGARIRLRRDIQGTHLKRWTLGTMVRTDFASRGVPWMRLLLVHRSRAATLNVGWQHPISMLVSLAGLAALAVGLPLITAASCVLMVALNQRFYRLVRRRRGSRDALLALPLHVLHHLAAAAAIPAGLWAGMRRGQDVSPPVITGPVITGPYSLVGGMSLPVAQPATNGHGRKNGGPPER